MTIPYKCRFYWEPDLQCRFFPSCNYVRSMGAVFEAMGHGGFDDVPWQTGTVLDFQRINLVTIVLMINGLVLAGKSKPETPETLRFSHENHEILQVFLTIFPEKENPLT